jgi:hypothetical protein
VEGEFDERKEREWERGAIWDPDNIKALYSKLNAA